MPKVANIPPYDAFMNPLLQALKSLGGSGTIEEINAKVIEAVGLSDEQLELIHDPERGSQTEVEYRLAWARTYLKRYGVIDNSSRGVWALRAKGREIDEVNPQAVKRYMAAEQRKKVQADGEKDELETVTESNRCNARAYRATTTIFWTALALISATNQRSIPSCCATCRSA